MEADEVYSQLSDKISGIGDKLSEYQGTIDSLQSSIRDQKSAVDKAQSDIDRINSALNDLKSGSGSSNQDNSQQTQGLFDQMKKIEEANAASQKKWEDQQGLIGKLAAQADDAAKMIVNFPDTAKAIANKAWDDGKKEILNAWESSKKDILDIWENSKKDILNSVSGITTPLIKEQLANVKTEIKDDLKSLIFDDVKEVQADAKSSQPAPLSDEELTSKIRTVIKLVADEKAT